MAIYKDKKRNTWYFRIYIENEKGEKKQKCRSGFKTKNEAKEYELKFLAECKKTFEDMTFLELYDIYIKHKSQNLKPQSLRAIKSRFNNHILPYFKDYKLSKISNKVYINWKEEILKKQFSYKYNSGLHTCMVSILNYAIDFYDLDKNIASKVGNFSKNGYLKKIDFWTYDEFNNFIVNVDDIVYYTLFYVLYFSGMRLGECLALSWKDFNNNCLNVNKTIAKGKRDGQYIITTPKTYSSIRKIKLDNKTIELLNDLKKYYSNYIKFSEDWFIFGGLNALSQTTIGRRKNIYCKKANVKQIRIHDLRHSHATFLLSKGVPITVISKRLGHTDISMTLNVYSHLIPEDEDKAINIINIINEKKLEKREFQENEKKEYEKKP